MSSKNSLQHNNDKNVTENDLVILRLLKKHGAPVSHTTSGFQLNRGEYLCNIHSMTRLRILGMVSKGERDAYWLTEAGENIIKGAVSL